jgi:hypothetical protein
MRLIDDVSDEKTKSVEPNVTNKNTIEKETIVNNLVFNTSECCLLNYLKSAILYTKIKYERIGTDIFISY